VFGRDGKGKVLLFLYLLGIVFVFVALWLGVVVFSFVVVMWLVFDCCVECYFVVCECVLIV